MYRRAIRRIRFWTDIILISISFFIATLFIAEKTDYNLVDIGLLVFLIAGWYFSTKSNNLYDEFRGVKGLGYEILRTFRNIILQAILLGLFLFAIKHPIYNRQFVAVYIFCLAMLLPIEKIFYKRIFMLLRLKNRNLRNVVIVGAGKVGIEFNKILTSNPYYGYQIVGFLDDVPKPHLNGQYLGKVDDLESLFKKNIYIDEVIVALPNTAVIKIDEVVRVATQEAARVRIIPDYFQFLSSRYTVDMFGNFPIITVRHEPLEEFHWQTVKRIFDISFSVLVLIFICSWLFPIIALIIKLDSRGPVFFIQERWGKQNRKIKCYKFRSMKMTSKDVDNSGKYKQASKNDPRITKVGRFLRKSSLDEFPQFINVLQGSMSIVGPRPHPTPLNLESRSTIDNYLARHLVKPGITGWAQVNGLRGETKDPALMRERVDYDIWYIENWHLKLDIKIIFLTAWRAVVGDKNAF